MRLIQNLKISWETNFYGKNTCKGKVISRSKVEMVLSYGSQFF
jgi:hypothetical protein